MWKTFKTVAFSSVELRVLHLYPTLSGHMNRVYSPIYSLTWLSEGYLRWQMITAEPQVSRACHLRLAISPSSLSSIWYEIWDGCPSGEGCQEIWSAGCQPDHGTILAKAMQNSNLDVVPLTLQTPPARTQPHQATEVPRNPAWPCSSLAALRLAALVWREFMMKKQSRRSLYPQGHFEKNSMFPLFFLQLRSQGSLNQSSCWLYS